MKWKGKLIRKLSEEFKRETKWKKPILRSLVDKNVGIHLAVFTEPFLSLMLVGEKKIESRFSISRVAPYGQINKGDIVLIKKSGGPIVGVFIAGKVNFLNNLNYSRLLEIEKHYGTLICSQYDPTFWRNRLKSNYATLIAVEQLEQINPIPSGKHDRRGWVILNRSFTDNLFEVNRGRI